ncbi:hypothetical protein [Archangium lansingense]|uniref:Uncharacterized protein n=1 Tax=Archangium lansingense TaxID=2995310 RepID=A0ABT3ZU09_9BACT|nr:hypothetical protein [Archangium lansinium]MCY1072884.1 hypothetical protein [Archangium lansinium]
MNRRIAVLAGSLAAFTTPEPIPVLTQGHAAQDVQVRVRPGG